jgi:hypothetical protein
MLRTISLALPIVASSSGCTQLRSKGAASQYCLVESDTPCAQVDGDGACQPCSESSLSIRPTSDVRRDAMKKSGGAGSE